MKRRSRMKMRFATNFGRKTKAFIGLIVLFFSIFLLPIQSYAALEEIKNGTDISTLDIRKFNLNINNVSVLSKSQSVDQFHLSNPHYEYLSGGAYPGEMENFTLKVDKSKKQDQVFENPLSLKFTNIGTVNGKQVDAYLNFNKVTLHYLNTAQAESEMNSAQKSTVEFFSISELWESNAFEIGNVPYVDANHDYIMNKAFWIDADVTAEIRYADGTETDLKLVMKPTDIDAIDANNLKETFYVKNYQNDVNLRLMNNANVLRQEETSDRTSWIATQITGGSYYENNVSGLALRSNSNSMNFGYSSTETCSAVFGLYIEKIDPRPVLEVDPAEIPAKEGQDVTYKATFKVPVPGKDILAAPSSIEMVQKFDERLDYKELKVESGGVTLQEGRDYTIEKTGQTVTVKMTPEYLKGNSSTDIIITYKTATNKKVEEKGSEKIDNTVTLHVDNLSAPSNQVSTALLYEKHHEFVSGTPGKELPQEVKDLLPATEKNLSNGSQVTPTQPSKTEVKTAEGTWSFKSYDKTSETINGADVKFVGTWEFTPTPTYKATHEFVSGTPGKELPQEVKALLPADQTDLKDGSQATPTQPSKTEVKTTEGTWSFKSYDKTSETINGADVKFVGTWEFTPAPTYKATHEFVSGTPGKELPQEVKALLPADQTDLKDGSQATPTQPSKTEVKTTEGTWSFKSYDKPSETINGADVKFVGTKKDGIDTFNYDEKLFFFLTSLSWRSLYLDIIDFVKEGNLKIDVLNKMIESEKIMREFLLSKRQDIGSIEHHIFFFDRIVKVDTADSILKNGRPHTIIHRSLTTYSGYLDNTIYTVSNLMGIVVVTLYSKDNDEEWKGTQVFNETNTLVAVKQMVSSRLGNEFSFWIEQSEQALNIISEETEQKILKRITDLEDGIKDYAIYQDIVDDFQLENNS